MAVPYYDFLMSPPTDQTGSALGTDFDYYNAFLNNSQYYQPGTGTADMANFTIGDQEYSFPSGSTYGQLEKYMTDKGASDLLTRNTGAIKPIDDSDSTGIGEIILPPIAGGGGGGGGVEGPINYNNLIVRDQSTGTGIDFIDRPLPQDLRTNTIESLKKQFNENKALQARFDTFDNYIEQSYPQGLEPKQNFLQKGIGSIKNFFTDSKFFQPKIQGQLGTRLAKQYTMGQKLPSFITAIAQTQSPFNPKSKNYNPLLEDQLNIAEANDKVGRDPNSGILKYSENSVLSGQNVISGFGTNDYEKQLENYLDKVQGVFDKKYGDVDITEYEDFSLKDLKALDPKNAFDAKKIAAATYKTKYINAAITELDPFKNKEYIEKKKQIEKQKKIKEEKKTTDDSTTGDGFKYDTNTTGTATSNQYGTYTQTVSPSQAATNRESRRGNYDSSSTKGTNTSASKQSKSSSSKGTNQGYSQHFKEGGKVRRSYFDGGIVTL